MKILIWVLGGLGGLVSTLAVAQIVASESGEVVVLTTRDAAGQSHETRLWVVDHEGQTWLRAGADAQGWFRRLEADPRVELVRAGRPQPTSRSPSRSAARS